LRVARNAEAQFILTRTPRTAAELIADDTRLGAVTTSSSSQRFAFVIGSTEEEVKRK
jgi:hypothetical protein